MMFFAVAGKEKSVAEWWIRRLIDAAKEKE
jgi:hypothetical protein